MASVIRHVAHFTCIYFNCFNDHLVWHRKIWIHFWISPNVLMISGSSIMTSSLKANCFDILLFCFVNCSRFIFNDLLSCDYESYACKDWVENFLEINFIVNTKWVNWVSLKKNWSYLKLLQCLLKCVSTACDSSQYKDFNNHVK